jgi:hypothetical protein
LSELEKLIMLCKEHRIYRLKTAEFEFELELPASEDATKAAFDMAAIMAKQTTISDEEILFNPMAGLVEKDDNYADHEHS